MIPDLTPWGSGEILRPLTGGYRSSPFLIRLKDRHAVIRHTDRCEPGLRWLQKALSIAARAGLAPPEMIRTLSGTLAAQGWRVEDFVEGAPATKRDLSKLRAPLRRFHAFGTRLARSQTRALPPMPAPLRASLLAMLPKTPLTVIHGDLHPGNLIRRPDGGLAVIDWDECRTGPADCDLMHLHRKSETARRQHLAHEALEGWTAEPEFSRMLVRRLRMVA